MSRQPRLRPDDLDAGQTALYRAIAEGPRSQGPQAFALTSADRELQGPFGGFLLSPAIGAALAEVGVAVRYRSQLSGRLRELAILVVAASQDSAFERAAHEAVGRTCGITEPELTAIRDGGLPELDDPVEAAGLHLASALTMGDVDDETWAQCVPPLTKRDVFELIALVGYYSTLALQMRVLRVE